MDRRTFLCWLALCPFLRRLPPKHSMLEAMHKAGVHPASIYAYQKTGRLVTRENRKYLTRAELKGWNDAFDKWHRLHRG